MPAFIGGIGPLEIIIILAVALIVFGRKLPDVAKQAGKAYFDFRRSLRGLQDEIEFTDARPVQDNRPGGEEPETESQAASPAVDGESSRDGDTAQAPAEAAAEASADPEGGGPAD